MGKFSGRGLRTNPAVISHFTVLPLFADGGRNAGALGQQPAEGVV